MGVSEVFGLLENSTRAPLEIRYSNQQIIKGKSHPTSVSIDCNAGVYLSAVKPALEKIYAGWKCDLHNTSITCEDVSHRNDMSRRKVCTKLVLYLLEQNCHTSKSVLHFYHTSNSVHIQGSSLHSTGVSSPVWLAENFLQPMVVEHAAVNEVAIQAINDSIQHTHQSSTFSCGSCALPINPSASKPKDQELPCNKCGKLFHKKCTDRIRSTSNWKRSPWYCPPCIQGTQALPNADSLLNPYADLFS